MSNSPAIPSLPSGAPDSTSLDTADLAPEPAPLPAEAITSNTGDAVVTDPAVPHSLHELRDAVATAMTNENARTTRLREFDRFASHLKVGVAELRQITSEHVAVWWAGMGKFSVASGKDRLKSLVAVFEIARKLGWITENPAQAFRDELKAARKQAAAQGATAPADAAEPTKVDAANVAPPPCTSDKVEQQKPVPPLQVDAPLPDRPATDNPAQAKLAAAEAKKRARMAKRHALRILRLILTPRARCAACENLTDGCKRGLPARWAAPDQEEATCLVTGHSRSTLRDMTDPQDGAPPEVKADNDKGQRIINGPDYCRYLGENEIKARESL